MLNLLSNSNKYTSEYGQVKIKLYKNNNNIFLSVKDNGLGISEKDLPFIFERFYRGDKSRNKNTGGTGIGLTISKALIEAHNGTIDVKSTLNEGSEFIVKL